MARVWVGTRTRVAYLRRLSVVFAVELRLRIVTELYMREMSPKQFFEEFGGGSVSRVDRNFKKLAEHGWLRYIRSETGGDRRGGTEHFYRATELAVFDYETWRLLPYSIRVAFSWRSFKQFAERFREAVEAGTFDARPDRHLSWTPLLLDQAGWDRVIAAVDSLFLSLFEEQEDARLRIYHSGEPPASTTVALLAFESPTRGCKRIGPTLAESDRDPLIPFPERLSKVFADELCLRIVAETNLREISAPLFHAEFGGDSIEGLRRRFQMLEKIGWLKKIEEKTGGKRRGATEYFYRATGPAIFDNKTWADVPASIKAAHSWTTFEQLSENVKEAMRTGTFDAREDRYLTWSLLSLDQQGWEKVIAAIENLFAFILKERADAAVRIANSDEKPITMTVAMAAYESPRGSAKEP